MGKKLAAILIFVLFQPASFADSVVCSKSEIRGANLKVLNQFGQEGLRFLRLKMGLYPRWTGPYGAKLLGICKTASDIADKSGEGSAIFIGLDSDLYKNLARSTNSWVSHTGLLFKEADEWFVYESRAPRGPPKPTPICDFIRRSAGYKFAIARVRNELSFSQIQILREIVRQESQLAYDFSFDISNQSTQFCSKLTFTAYRAIGLEFGKIQSLQQILSEYRGPQEDRKELGCFWMAWTGAAKIVSKHQLSIFDWTQLTITPASQYQQAVAGRGDPENPFVLVFQSRAQEHLD